MKFTFVYKLPFLVFSFLNSESTALSTNSSSFSGFFHELRMFSRGFIASSGFVFSSDDLMLRNRKNYL